MNNVIGRIPEGAPILITAINDQTATAKYNTILQTAPLIRLEKKL